MKLLKNNKLFYILFVFLLFFHSELFCRGYYHLSKKQIETKTLDALKGDVKAALNLSEYYSFEKHDYNNAGFWIEIACENEKNKNGVCAHTISAFLDFENDSYKEIREKYWIWRCKASGYDGYFYKIADFSPSKDSSYTDSLTAGNIENYKEGALSGSGKAALLLAKHYEKTNVKMVLNPLSVGINSDDVGIYESPVFWYRIGAQNNNKECQKIYGQILLNSESPSDKMRGEFWIKYSEEVEGKTRFF